MLIPTLLENRAANMPQAPRRYPFSVHGSLVVVQFAGSSSKTLYELLGRSRMHAGSGSDIEVESLLRPMFQCARVCVCVCVCKYVYIYIIYVYIYIYTYVYVYIYMYIYVYTPMYLCHTYIYVLYAFIKAFILTLAFVSSCLCVCLHFFV